MNRVLENPTDPSDWEFEPLKELDGLLRCSICLEYYNTAMIMPGCSHNYCSLCIRRYLVVRPQCPTCAAPATDSQLRNNRILDELVEQFTGSRKEFMSLVSSRAATKSKNGLLQISLASPEESTSSYSRANITNVAMEKEGISMPGNETEREDSVCSHGNYPKTKLERQQNLGSSSHVPEPPSLLLLEDSIFEEETQTSSNSSKKLAVDDSQSTSSSRDRHTGGSHYKFQSAHTHSESLSDTGTTTLTSTCTTIKKRPSTSSLFELLDPSSDPRTPLPLSTGTSTTFSPPSTPKLPLTRKVSVKRETSPVLTPISSSGCHTPLRASRMAPTPSPSTSTHSVDCPVCGLVVQQKHINSHLDLCLNKTSKQCSPNVSSGCSLPRLPKLCFNIMKEKQLKNKLREYHLPTHGSRQAMMSRLQEFTLQYNAQCDSLNPKTPQQIAQEVEKAEQKKLSKKLTSQQQPVRRDSTKEEIEHQRQRYEQTHEDHFAKLIGEMKRRGGRGGGEASSDPNATGKAQQRKKERKGEPMERSSQETTGGSSDVEIIERGREVLAVDSSDSGDELPMSVWAVASRMGTTTWPGNETGATTIPESPRVVRQSTRTKRKRHPITADTTTSLDPLEDESHESLDSETEVALSSEEDPDFMPATPNFRTTPTLRSKKRLKRK